MTAHLTYSADDWYWVVAGDDSIWWSSKAAAYVPPDQAFLDADVVPTRIADEIELVTVLERAGVGIMAPQRDFTQAELVDAMTRIEPGRAAEFDRKSLAEIETDAVSFNLSIPQTKIRQRQAEASALTAKIDARIAANS